MKRSKKQPAFAEQAFNIGMNQATRALRDFEKENSHAEGFCIHLWADGSGELIQEGMKSETLIYSFNRPSELWAWLHADHSERQAMQSVSLRRQYRERRKLEEFEPKGRVQ